MGVLTAQDRSLTFADMALIRGTCLTGYAELVAELGGDLRLTSADTGTELVITLPLAHVPV